MGTAVLEVSKSWLKMATHSCISQDDSQKDNPQHCDINGGASSLLKTGAWDWSLMDKIFEEFGGVYVDRKKLIIVDEKYSTQLCFVFDTEISEENLGLLVIS